MLSLYYIFENEPSQQRLFYQIIFVMGKFRLPHILVVKFIKYILEKIKDFYFKKSL